MRKATRPYLDINCASVQKIIALKNSGFSLEKIGRELRVSPQRIGQQVKKISSRFGTDVFVPEVKTFWTPREAADALGFPYDIVVLMCRDGKIPCKHRGISERKNHFYIITPEGMEILREYVGRERRCEICGNEIGRKPSGALKKSCNNPVCRRKHYRLRQLNYMADKAAVLQSLKGWRKNLWLALQGHVAGEDEEWVTFSEAAAVSGLSKTQVWYLRKCGLISSRPDPAQISNKRRQTCLYSLTEMKIAKRVTRTR